MVERALGREEKAVRRREILQAAADLFKEGSGELPTMAEIAARADLAKGTAYLYFGTKEAIFSQVLFEGWREVFNLVEDLFAFRSSDAHDHLVEFLQRLTEHLRNRPELLQLDAIGHGVLKARLPFEERRALANAYSDGMKRSGEVLDRSLELPNGRGERVLARTYALIRGLWQSLGETNDEGSPAETAFFVDLDEALREYWSGALLVTSRETASDIS